MAERGREGLAVIVPTRNRAELLFECINHFLDSRHLRIVVVVDSSDSRDFSQGDEVIKILQLEHPELEIVHVPCQVGSLTMQKNAGLRYLENRFLVAYQIVDDDVLINGVTLDLLFDLLSSEPGVAAVSGVTEDSQESKSQSSLSFLVDLLLGLTSRRPGVISLGGCGVPAQFKSRDSDLEVMECDWLIGCSMFKADAIEGMRYEEKFKGSALFEDVEFSRRVGKIGKLLAANLTIQHMLHQSNRPNDKLFAQRFAQNRHLVCQGMGIKNVLIFWVGTVALTLIHVCLSPLRTRSKDWTTGTAHGIRRIFSHTWD